jgi:phosphopantothenoylcysteine decarboxylase/phosphopantothenate--cysteine ligase
MGHAIARAAVEAGARVHLVSGPGNLPTPLEFTGEILRINVQYCQRNDRQAVMQIPCDIFCSVAAVADWTIKRY